MVRLLPVLLGLVLTGFLEAADLGRTSVLWREYLSETVKRGLPLLNSQPDTAFVPRWPTLDRGRADAASLEPGADVDLLSAWIDLQEGNPVAAAATLKTRWPQPGVTRWSSRHWAEALFAAWDPSGDPETWTRAWLAWEDKAYSPQGLVRGIEVFEKSDTSAVVPLLGQALELYPEDRRFLGLMARHPEVVNSAEGVIALDKMNRGGWSTAALRTLLDRSPAVKDLLLKAGYSDEQLDRAQSGDYGVWLGQSAAPTDGSWRWDADLDGVPESSLVFQKGTLATWTRASSGGLWTLSMTGGKPDTVSEARGGGVWTLRYQAYPWARTLEYRWGNTTLVYRFRPLAQAAPLWPAERFSAPAERLPAALAAFWLPLDPKALAASAATVETWEAGVKVGTVFLLRGEVWMTVEDANRDGRDDTWSYFRSGQLASVYRDFEGRGQAGLRELYTKGQLTQVQSRQAQAGKTEFVLFPIEGVQLWDPHGAGRPLDRIFLWSGGERLDALVFSGAAMPWETMPAWEPRP